MKYRIECEAFGALHLRKKNKGNRVTLNVPESTTYRQLLISHLKFSPVHVKYLTLMSNGRKVEDLSERIDGPARVTILMPVGGG
ncbi:MAG: hypothetical protein KJ967_01080 [Elusimicrobia bacterium]|nr:hypothetical protein [Elusimicrobiota bacterium]